MFSHRIYESIKASFDRICSSVTIPEYPPWDKEGTFDFNEWVLVKHDIEDVKRLMWDYVGIVRSDHRLQRAYKRILFLADEIHSYYRRSTISSRVIELRNLATVAKLIIKSAMIRDDSIGLHYNTDHPETHEDKKHVVLRSQYAPRLINFETESILDKKWVPF